jgi:hypothetical protein
VQIRADLGDEARPSRGRVWRWLLLAAFAAGFLVLLLNLDLPRLWEALSTATWSLVLLAATLNLTLNLWARVRRWAVLLEPLSASTRPGVSDGEGTASLSALFLASQAANNILPARAGEALLLVHLRRRGYALGQLLAWRLFDKVVELVSLGLVALPVVLFAALPRGATLPLWLLVGSALAALVGVGLAARSTGEPLREGDSAREPDPLPERGPRRAVRLWLKVRSAVKRFAAAVRVIHSPRTWLRAVGWSLLSDLADAAMIGLCLEAVGLSLGMGDWVMILLAVNVAIIAPSTPGQLGVLEAAAMLVLSALGVGPERALAFAVLYHAAHLVLVTLIGSFALRYLLDEPHSA